MPRGPGGMEGWGLEHNGSEPPRRTRFDFLVWTEKMVGMEVGMEVGVDTAQSTDLLELRARVKQLQTALDTRIVIEQAKGILAERFHLPVDDAFLLLRYAARSSR